MSCYTPNCQARFHHHCLKRYRKSPRGNVCPACKSDWSKPDRLHKVGEDAAQDGDEPPQNQRHARRSDSRNENDGESEETDGDGTLSPSSRRESKPRKSKGRGQTVTDDEEAGEEEEEEKEEGPEVKATNRRR